MKEKGLLVKVIPLKVLFEGENDSGTYRVVSCKQELHDSIDNFKIPTSDFNTFTISGENLTDLQLDVPYDMFLLESENSRYKNSYVAQIPILDIPSDPKGQWDFLARATGTRSYEGFERVYKKDEKIIDFILNEKNKNEIIDKVNGIGASTYGKLIKRIKDESELAKAYNYLSEYTFTDNLVKKIYEKYGSLDKIKEVIEENIFNLTSISGVGFKTIDAIYLAQENSSRKDEKRISSGISYFMQENQLNGNTRVLKGKLLTGTQRILNIPKDLIEEALGEKLVELSDEQVKSFDLMYKATSKMVNGRYENSEYDDKVVLYKGYYSSVDLFLSEYYVYSEILSRASQKSFLRDYDFDKLIEDYRVKTGFALSDEQKKFFEDLLNSKISFLLGSSGTGKSSVQAVLLEYARKTNQKVLFLAPTGMARKRISEVTGSVAYTIHSFLLNEALNKDVFDIYLVDETSMVDIALAKAFFKKVPADSKIVFVGDGSQIPSVSCGNFLYDCTNNDSIVVNNFTQVFRQKDGGILDIATKIRKGEATFLPSTFNGRKVFGNNCVFDMRTSKSETVVEKILKSFKNTIETGRYTEDDIIILTPTKKGSNGTVSINNTIQKYLNGEMQLTEIKTKEEGLDVIYRVGDKIINKVNRKNVDLFVTNDSPKTETDLVNGDIGKIIEIRDSKVIVDFEGKKVYLDKSVFRNGSISHGWAITGHKSQGSEFKVVFCLFDKSSNFQLNGNLMYTMVSRAKELLLVMGQMKAINVGMKKFENIKRETNLSVFFDNKVEI